MIEKYYAVGIKYGRQITYLAELVNFTIRYTEDPREAMRLTKQEAIWWAEEYRLKYWYLHVDMETGKVLRRYKP